jgi:hypothetical protein
VMSFRTAVSLSLRPAVAASQAASKKHVTDNPATNRLKVLTIAVPRHICVGPVYHICP